MILMEQYKQQLLQELKQLKELKKTRNCLDDILAVNAEIKIRENQLMMIDLEERCN